MRPCVLAWFLTIGPLPQSLFIADFIDAPTRESLLQAMRAAPGALAGTYGRGDEARLDRRVRSARRLEVGEDVRRAVMALLTGAQSAISRHFGVPLGSVEPPQFLHYAEGDFFVAHQDGNTPLIRDASLDRRVSVVLFLNDCSAGPVPGTYGGGSLVLHGAYPYFEERQVVPAAAGALVAFRSETTHEVTPVTHGDRYTIVSWYRR